MFMYVRSISKRTRSITKTMRLAGIVDQYNKDTTIVEEDNQSVWYSHKHQK